MKTAKQKMITAVILSFILLTSSSCGGSRTSQSAEQTGTGDPLSFRITWLSYSGRGEAIQKIVGRYNEKYNKGDEVVLEGGDEDLAAIEGTFANKASGSAVYVLPYRYVKYLGGKGYLTDLTKAFAKEEALFYPELWSLGTVQDTVYGIPWLGHSICLIYNKDLLDAAGVDGSSVNSLQTLTKALEAVESKTPARGIGLVGANHNDVSWMVNQFIYGYGSSLVNEDGTKVVVNNSQSKEAIEFYKNVLGAHAQPTWTEDTGVEVMKYFRDQQVAFEFQGIWGVTDIEKNGQPFHVGVIALKDIGLCAEVGPMTLAIPKDLSGERKKEAAAFIHYMISKEAQEMIMDGEYSPEHEAYYPFRTPVRTDMKESAYFESHPEYVPFIAGFENPSIDVPVPKWQTIKDEYYAPGLHEVMKGEMSVSDFLKTIQVKGDEILAEDQ